jgi:hypothetical protein
VVADVLLKCACRKPVPLEHGAHEWNRTIDLLLTKEVLYRLSYVSDAWCVPREINGAGDGDRTRTISLEG